MLVSREKCFICGELSDFIIKDGATLLREATCYHCHASIRNSDLAKIIVMKLTGKDKSIQESLGELKNFRILEAGTSGAIHQILRHLPYYQSFEYFDDVEPGKFRNGIQSNNLEKLTYSNHSFDLIITQDVMEHVKNPSRAFLEINRVLDDGGYHIFTVPLHEGRRTKSRKSLREIYHGDPLRQEGALVITDWGDDLSTIMDEYGMETETFPLHIFYNPHEITDVDQSYEEYKTKDPLFYYRYNSIVFASKKINNLEKNRDHMIILHRFGPEEIKEKTKFNIQPNGESAIWVHCEHATETTVIVIDDVQLDTTIQNEGQLATAYVPEWLYQDAGEYPIYLYDKTNHTTSNKLTFTVQAVPQTTDQDLSLGLKQLKEEVRALHKQIHQIKRTTPPLFEGWGMTSEHELPWNDEYYGEAFIQACQELKENFMYGLYEDIGIDAKNVDTLQWRHWVVAFAVQYAKEFNTMQKMNLVECGVGDGMSAFIALKEMKNDYDYTMHLYDSWETMLSEDLTSEEMLIQNRYKNNSLERTKHNLKEFSKQLIYHVGYVPASLTIEPIFNDVLQYLHIDLNSMKSTLSALEYFYPLMSTGSVILFDDYGWSGFKDTKKAIDTFFHDKPGTLLKMPTGQALYFVK